MGLEKSMSLEFFRDFLEGTYAKDKSRDRLAKVSRLLERRYKSAFDNTSITAANSNNQYYGEAVRSGKNSKYKDMILLDWAVNKEVLDLYETLVHEQVHIISSQFIYRNKSSKMVRNLNDNMVRAEAVARNTLTEDHYAELEKRGVFEDVQEFLAEAFSSVEFQKFLNSVKTKPRREH